MEGSNACEGCPAYAELAAAYSFVEAEGSEPHRLERIDSIRRSFSERVGKTQETAGKCPGPQMIEEEKSIVCPLRNSVQAVAYFIEGPLPSKQGGNGKPRLVSQPNEGAKELGAPPGQYL